MKRWCIIPLTAVLIAVMSGCSMFKSPRPDTTGRPPQVEREFRGAWVATVGNIDWPSKPGLSVEDQKKEAIAILDTAVKLNLNAIVFQVRPHCDALYASTLEPWSYYLTGVQGAPPNPYYDPLEFWVEESHNRGLELHAWFNPYRAHLGRGGSITDSSIVRKKPGLAKQTDDNTWWLDPAKKEVQEHSYAVVMDVVRRYDVDGIHFDDYFYPYGDGNFPDDDTWEEYQKGGGSLSRQDWRRDAVNSYIQRLSEGIRKEKPYVKFGISPFGIWRPGNPPSIAGFDQYNGLYADARLWLNEGWVDYFTPQLYWPINQIPQSFPVLLGWWSKENLKGRNLWPGMIIGRANNERGADEILNQIMIERGFVPEAPGHIHFSMRTFLRDSSVLSAALLNGPYRNPALVPPSPWMDDKAPAAPAVTADTLNDTLRISWTHPDPKDVFRYVVAARFERGFLPILLNRNDRTLQLPLSRLYVERFRNRRREDVVQQTIERLVSVTISAVDRVGNESQTASVPVPALKPLPQP